MTRRASTSVYQDGLHDNPRVWTWAAAANRTAQVVTPAQVGSVGYQSDMGLEYVLTSQSGGVGVWDPRPWADTEVAKSWQGVGGGTTIESSGLLPFFIVGAGAAINPSSTSKSTALHRTSLSATAGIIGVLRAATTANFYSSIGFRFRAQVVLGTVVAGYRWFAGLCSSAAPIATNIDPGAWLTNAVGIGRGNGETYVQRYTADASARTQADVSTFAAATTALGYEIECYSRAGATIAMQVRAINTPGSDVSVSISSTLPVTTQGMIPLIYCADSAGAGATSINLANFTIATLR